MCDRCVLAVLPAEPRARSDRSSALAFRPRAWQSATRAGGLRARGILPLVPESREADSNTARPTPVAQLC